ncbi:TonB-dependent receptor domain-containing protein [Myxacorys almedinensis]|uniref:TonB-dependent receptor n=1 Tax=Myxacorys almedinensis A TaxID=2690445 RepID=A0A8J7Z2Q3_9CYAN|nr:TonB-dependent receptor [Myxacorys almedinensis A]
MIAAQAAQAEEALVPRVREVEQPSTTLKDWNNKLQQQAIAQSQPTIITGIKLNPTREGLQLILETAKGESLKATSRLSGNALIFEIANAQLQRPFQQDKPAAGIASVKAIATPNNIVQVIITGTSDAPDGEIMQSASGAIFSVLAFEPEEEVTVTAQKRPERAQDVPISLTVLDSQQIQDAGIRSVQDIANRTPNFSAFSANTARVFTFYSVRGLSNSNFLSQKDVIGFYVDDVPYEYGGFIDFDLFDVDRIEVLRGPQSTLYGRNSQAGVVNIVTRRPTNQPEIRAILGYGSYDTKELGLSLSDAVIPDQLSFRLAGSFRQTDGYFFNRFLNDDTVGRQRSLNGRAELLWTPSEDWDISLRVAANSAQDGDGVFSAIDAANPYRVDYNTPGGFLNNDTFSQALRIAYRNPAFTATSITTHRTSKQRGFAESDYSPLDIFTATYAFANEALTQEFRIQSPETARNFKWLLGTYLNFSNFATPTQDFNIIGTGTQRIVSDEDQRGFAVFGQVDVKPSDRLTLTAGLRYETNSAEISRSTEFIPEGLSSGFFSGVFNNIERNENVFLPRFAVQYAFSPDVQVYGSVTRGYKPGGFNLRAETRNVLEFQPEKSWNYEVGIKSSLFDNKLTASLAYFITDVDDYQVISAGPDGIFRDVSNAQVNINGLELELLAKPAPGFELNASLGYVNGRYNQFVNPFLGTDFSGNRVTYSPRITYNVGAQYRSPNGLFARAEVQGFGTTFFDDANQIRRAPFALVNARIGYEGKNYGVYLFGNNLFDTRYYTQAFVFPPPNVIAAFGNRATYGVQLKLNF